MPEEINNQPNSVEVDDIFSSVVSGPVRLTATPVNNISPEPAPFVITDEVYKKVNARKRIKFFIIFIIIAIVALGGACGYSYIIKSQTNENSNQPTTVLEDEGLETVSNNTNTVSEIVDEEIDNAQTINIVEPVMYIDTDHDGLSDEMEGKYKTAVNSPDTDADGLTDREEVKVYLTDPLNPDTDGDGYADGHEVKSGYNPRGEGYLIDFKKELDKKLNR
ncbi:MAG: hypothetical protein V1898_02650 [Patescibacteria group bacterium]